MKIKLIFYFLVLNCFFSLAEIKKDPPLIADTLKGIETKRVKTDSETEYYVLNNREFWFPQYFICEAVKDKKLKVWSPLSDPWKGTVEFEKSARDSLFWRKKDVSQFDIEGNEIAKETEFYQAEGFVCKGYDFFEELWCDEATFKIKTGVKGIKLIIQQDDPLADSAFFYYAPSGQNSICSAGFLLLKSQQDTLRLSNFSEQQKKALNSILLNCIRWSAQKKRVMFQNGKQLDKKEAKKLLAANRDNGILSGVKEIRIAEDWFFDTASCAFQKEIKQLKVISEKGTELFSFGF